MSLCTIIKCWQKSYLFIFLFTYLIMYDMYSSYRYFIYEFLFMCLFMYFIVYWGYSKFVYELMFLMYLVMDHMHWICYVFKHSSSIWSATETIINWLILFYFVLFQIFPPADNRIYLFVCSCISEMNLQMEKQVRHVSRLCVHQ